MNWCNCATSFPECKRCGLKCYPTPDSIQKLKADLTREREAANEMRAALKNIIEEPSFYASLFARQAIAKADEIRGEK